MTTGYSLTAEQQAILRTLPPPNHHRNVKQKGKLIRITAAAGAGKTTTLLALAELAAQSHYQEITYLTFAKAAAKDGLERFRERQIQGKIDVRTLHSAAYRLARNGESDDVSSRMWEDADIKRWIENTCINEIDSFLRPCYAELARKNHGSAPEFKRDAAKDQVVFFIFKSLQHFCQSKFSVRQYKAAESNVPFGRDYFPAVIFHSHGGNGPRLGFEERYYRDQVEFYAKQAIRLWEMVKPHGLRAFDFDMKRVQLEQLHVPCSLLLVDECQDLDACQIDWIRQHIENGSHVYMVGDPVQAIYQFRGAKPKCLQEIPADYDMKLTESFRFGPAVMNIANLVLFAKENSAQTKLDRLGRYTTWMPYRVKTSKSRVSHVTSDSLLSQWRIRTITLIGRSNIALMMEALRLMGRVVDNERAGDHDGDGLVLKIDPENVPKFHMNGRGESSGLGLWKKTIDMVKAVYNLYTIQGVHQLDKKIFPDFNGKKLCWNQFLDEIVNKELTKYAVAAEIVKRFKRKTLAAIDAFQQHVIDPDYSVEEANIILTTCHSAKGMEWDNVQLCDDFIDLAVFKKERTAGGMSSASKLKCGEKWSFHYQSWGDDLNLVYVACTRARINLCVPTQVQKLIRILDSAMITRDAFKDIGSLVAFSLPGENQKPLQLSAADLGSFVGGLVQPLRNEMNAPINQSLWSTLITDAVDDDDYFQEVSMPHVVTPPRALSGTQGY